MLVYIITLWHCVSLPSGIPLFFFFKLPSQLSIAAGTLSSFPRSNAQIYSWFSVSILYYLTRSMYVLFSSITYQDLLLSLLTMLPACIYGLYPVNPPVQTSSLVLVIAYMTQIYGWEPVLLLNAVQTNLSRSIITVIATMTRLDLWLEACPPTQRCLDQPSVLSRSMVPVITFIVCLNLCPLYPPPPTTQIYGSRYYLYNLPRSMAGTLSPYSTLSRPTSSLSGHHQDKPEPVP